MTLENSSLRERWEHAHEDPRFRPAYPHEQVVRWAFRTLDRAATPKARVLDLGCGAGRHALFLASEGFDTDACDLSAVGLRELQVLAQRRHVTVRTPRRRVTTCRTTPTAPSTRCCASVFCTT